MVFFYGDNPMIIHHFCWGTIISVKSTWDFPTSKPGHMEKTSSNHPENILSWFSSGYQQVMMLFWVKNQINNHLGT
jgi:hypothetical protein